MTPEQLEAQSRAAIIAHLNDPSVQLEFKSKEVDKWLSLESRGEFYTRDYYYRIVKPKKWYRVAKMNSGTETADSKLQEYQLLNSPDFIEWLDEKKYYY